MSQPLTAERKRRRWRLWFVPVLAIACDVGFVATRLFLFRPELEVGRETTFVDGPLRADGTVNFTAALNAEWSKGVTPENNAAVPLARAFGPGAVPPEIREEYFRLLKTEVPPEQAAYLVSLDDYLKGQGVAEERRYELFDVDSAVWRGRIAETSPELVGWVARNERPMELVVEASRRTRYFEPVVPTDGSDLLSNSGVPSVTHRREAARLLRTRAALRLERGDVEGACEDALTCHRLSRLFARHPTTIHFLVGIAVEAQAAEISEAIALSGELTPALATRFRREFDALPPFPDVAEVIDRGERLYSLDSMFRVPGSEGGPPETNSASESLATSFSPNVLLREINRFYDANVEAMRIEDRAERKKRLAQVAETYRRDRKQGMGLWVIASAMLWGDAAPLTKQVAHVLLSLMAPAIEQAQGAEDRVVTRATLCRVGWAIAEHRAVEGRYPESFDELRARFPDGLPTDLYSGKSFKYRRVESGFLLYSVGSNGRDDGGWSYAECEGGISDTCDDVRFGVDPAGVGGPPG